MSKTMQRAVGAVVATAILASMRLAAAGEVPDARVRALTPRLAGILVTVAAESETLRRLVARIGATDGVVYLSEGKCRRQLRACLLHAITIAGPNRVLHVRVDPRNSDRAIMGSLGHELQHAVEVPGDRTIRSDAAILLFYRAKCTLCRGQFETDEAIRAGNAVQDELRKGDAANLR